MRMLFTSALTALSVACGGDEGTGVAQLLSVGGTYQTAVVLLQSSCQGTQVQTFPTVVTHTVGSSSLTLSPGGSTYSGSVDSTGAFRSPEAPFTIGGTTYRIAITGTFTMTAMDATVTVAPQITPACSFTARWQGPKSGPPNVIP